jgi:hypothetical protein
MNNIPDNLNIQPKILMCDYVPQACSLTPGKIRMLFFEALWHLPRGFANDLKAMNHGKKCTAVILQFSRRVHALREV